MFSSLGEIGKYEAAYQWAAAQRKPLKFPSRVGASSAYHLPFYQKGFLQSSRHGLQFALFFIRKYKLLPPDSHVPRTFLPEKKFSLCVLFFTVHAHPVFHLNGNILQEDFPSCKAADIGLEGTKVKAGLEYMRLWTMKYLFIKHVFCKSREAAKFLISHEVWASWCKQKSESPRNNDFSGL